MDINDADNLPQSPENAGWWELHDKCEICGAEPMTANCNNAACDK